MFQRQFLARGAVPIFQTPMALFPKALQELCFPFRVNRLRVQAVCAPLSWAATKQSSCLRRTRPRVNTHITRAEKERDIITKYRLHKLLLDAFTTVRVSQVVSQLVPKIIGVPFVFGAKSTCILRDNPSTRNRFHAANFLACASSKPSVMESCARQRPKTYRLDA